MSFDPYAAQSSSYGIAPDLQFYNGAAASTSGTSMHASSSLGMGSMHPVGAQHGSSSAAGAGGMDYYGVMGATGGPTGNMQSGNVGGVMLSQGGFWSAFSAAPIYEGEPPLLEGERRACT